MESGIKRSRKSKLVLRDITDSDDEIIELQNEVERTLSRFKRVPIARSAAPPAPPPVKSPSPLPLTTSAPPIELSVKVEVENLDEDELASEKEPAQLCDADEITYEDIINESQKIVSKSKNICDKILHIQVLNACRRETPKVTKSSQEKLLDKALLRWREWACFTEENKEPPLFYKCYVCQMAWWHLHQFREHLQIHTFKSLRVNIEINDYVECNIVAYVDRSEKKFIDLEGKCWRCGGNALEHIKPKHCLGCNKQMFSCTKRQEHQWYCEQFKQKHIKLFQCARKIFKCHLCRMYYFSSEELMEHMVLKHTVRSDLPVPGYNAVCNLCNGPSEAEHVCGNQLFQENCQFCKKKFPNRSTATMHRLVWKNSKICPYFSCNVKIRRECMLSDHASTHTDNYCLAYKCLACPELVFVEPTQSKHHTANSHQSIQLLGKCPQYDPIYIPTVLRSKLKEFGASTEPDPSDCFKIQIKSKVLPPEAPGERQNSKIIDSNSSEIHKNLSQSTEIIQSDLSIVKTEPSYCEYMDVDEDVTVLDSCRETGSVQSGDGQTVSEMPCIIANIKSEPDCVNNVTPLITNIKSEKIDAGDENVENNVSKTKNPHEIAEESNCSDTPKVTKTYCRKSKVLKPSVISEGRDLDKSQKNSDQIANKQNGDDVINEGSQKLLSGDEIKKERDDTVTVQGVLARENCSVMTNVEKNSIESTETVMAVQRNVSRDNKTVEKPPEVYMHVKVGSIHNNPEIVLQTQTEKTVTEILKDSNVENVEVPKSEISATNTGQNSDIYDKDLKIKKEPSTETESDLKLEDIKKIYHIDVNLGADPTNNLNVKQEMKEIEVRGPGEDSWELCADVFGSFNEVQPESDEEFESDLIIIEPKLEVTTVSDEDQQNCTSEPEDRDVEGTRKRKIYKCKRCSFQGYHKSYAHHKRDSCPRGRRERFAEYACSKCLLRFDGLRPYLRHFVEHDYPKLACPKCPHISRNMFNLETHVFAHVKSMFIMYRAIDSSEETRKCAYRCKVCERNVLKAQFFQHWDSHVALRDWGARDREELVSSSRDPSIGKVIELFTNTEKLNDMTRKNFRSCIICCREFNRRNDCKRHMIEHLLTDAYKMKSHFSDLRCQICDMGFQKTEGFRAHMRNHASLPVYKCEICNKTFSDSSNFSKHKKVHNFSIHTCDICAKKFNNKHYLVRHLKLHETTKPIKCEHCEKIFFSQSPYRKHHQNVHEPSVPRFKCRQCDLAFLSLKEKWDHMWHLHKERKAKADCHLCTAKFRKISDVKRHVEKEHNSSVKETRNGAGSRPKSCPARPT